MNQTINRSSRLYKWLLAIFCGFVFLGLALSLDSLGPVDQAVYRAVSALHSPMFTAFFNGCTVLASALPLLVFSFILAAFMPHKEYRIPLLANLAFSVLLNLGLKTFFARVRPTEVAVLVTETGYSFPSGHTMAAACFYGFLIFLVLHSSLRPWLRRLITGFLSAIILLVGVSRIYLGVHFFSDVLGGLCVSVVYLVIYISFIQRYFTHEEIAAKKALGQPASIFKSFSYAFEGIGAGLKTERNMVVHFAAIAGVTVFGAILGLSAMEWIACLILFGLVLMAELINTAVETVVDMITTEIDPRAKLAKDTAAGAVLVISIGAVIVGAIIFAPKLLAVMRAGMLPIGYP